MERKSTKIGQKIDKRTKSGQKGAETTKVDKMYTKIDKKWTKDRRKVEKRSTSSGQIINKNGYIYTDYQAHI